MARIKLVLLLFVFIASVSACKKSGSGEDVDPREQYLGVYDIDYSSKTLVGDINFNEETNKGTITISKGGASNELSLLITFPNYNSTEIVKLNGSQITMTRTQEKVPFGNKVYDAEFSGKGTIEGRILTLTSLSKYNQGSTSLQWTRAYKGTRK